ncbi:rSAM/selenodomain-associated transferase 2 [Oceanisphaera litoralis]|uniref:TIGR04283 family arsenosugar biosynthesis glycosyltransferase n=1 Tax=Oceanisphaera litoralis TaxID=225144 RepID=UPI001EF9822B|nr:TIGR04283 family arsenosugar biosynthesis glycosyltransferase [Oceanisphaera litoralis]MBM7456999.1 rSAM/selenodomain-associated transferase 2 [Oceanisphaera litoralis]
MSLSIIIPMLNEADALPDTLKALRPYSATAELILVDGGSSDDSVALAHQAGMRVLAAPAGRALQMNAGAAAARGDLLLFLHADTRLPANADRLIADALVCHHWGRFDVTICGRHPMLAVIAGMMNLRSRLTGIATGDQALFVRRRAFEAVGGFPEQPLMEDIALGKRLKHLGPPACLRQKVITSGRRWEQKGLWRTMVLMWRLRFAYWRGASPEQLARAYR